MVLLSDSDETVDPGKKLYMQTNNYSLTLYLKGIIIINIIITIRSIIIIVMVLVAIVFVAIVILLWLCLCGSGRARHCRHNTNL